MRLARSVLGAALLAVGVTGCTPPDMNADVLDAGDAGALDTGDAGAPDDVNARDVRNVDCTLVGCDAGPLMLAVRDASGHPVTAFTVQVTGAGRMWSVMCSAAATGADAGSCVDGMVDLTFRDSTGIYPPDASSTLQIQTAGGLSWSGTLASIQAPHYPNGPSCDPACYSSPITFMFTN